jgi:hypothetical protein
MFVAACPRCVDKSSSSSHTQSTKCSMAWAKQSTKNSQADFRERYARARERQADFLAAQVVEIADTVREGKKVKVSQKDGTTEEHGDQVDRSRLMVDARKWLAAKLAPKKYGDKVAAEVSGPDGGPIQNNVNFRFFDDKPPEK